MKTRAIVFPVALLAVAFSLAQAPLPNPWKKRVLTKDFLTEGLAAGDLDRDGRTDFITGKRYYAHNGKDPGAEDPALAVVFFNRKEGDGVRWQAEVIDTDSGVGCQVLAVDLDGNGTLEFAAGNKKGVHVIGR